MVKPTRTFGLLAKDKLLSYQQLQQLKIHQWNLVRRLCLYDGRLRDYLKTISRYLNLQNASFGIQDGDQVCYYSPTADKIMQQPISRVPSAYCFEHKKPLVIDDVQSHPQYPDWSILHEVAPIALAAHPIILSDGEVCGVLGTSRNCTGPFAAEELTRMRDFCRLLASEMESRREKAYAEASSAILETVLDAISDPLLVTDSQGNYLWANPAMRRVVGPDRRSVFERRDVVQILDEEMQPIPEQEVGIIRTLQNHETVEQESFAISDSYPLGRWVQMRSCPLETPNGQVLGAVLYTKDITTRKLKEAELANQAAKDETTGLLNRRGFERMANPLMSLSWRQGLSVHIVGIQLLGISELTEAQGEIGRDSLISGFANLLRNTVRSCDLVGRATENQFLILAIGSDPEILLNRIRSQSEQRNQRLSGLPSIHWSFGLLLCQPGQTLEQMIETVYIQANL